MAGKDISLRSALEGRKTGRTPLHAGLDSPGRTGDLQRVSAASVAAQGGRGGAGAVCARVARRRRAIADCGGDAGGCAPATGGGEQADRRRVGKNSGPAAGRSFETARTDAADEGD